MNQQLALAIQLNDEATLQDFHWGGNELLQQQINTLLNTPYHQPVLYIWGGLGCGKSHLLQACCQALIQDQAIYLPLRTLIDIGPGIIDGLDSQGLIAIDDIDAIAGNPAWEEALFHLYNRIRDNQSSRVIITAQTPPASTGIALADLRSRLSWGLVFQLLELDDEAKIQTLQRHAKKRGFELPASVAQFLIARCTRNMHDLHHLLNQLDNASLAFQRKITIPFVKSVLPGL